MVTHAGPDAEAILLAGDRVLAVGSVADLSARAPAASRWDYPGATVVPGFNDAHQHLTMLAAQSTGLDLSAADVDHPERLAAALAAHAAGLPAGGWVVASRYDHVRSSAGSRLTRAELDAIVPDRPAIVVHIGAHWGVANSRALALGGVTDESPDPPGGEFGRDAAGRLNGFLAEQALFDFVYPSLASRDPVVPATSLDDLVAGVFAGANAMLAAGLTSVGDAMVGPRELEVLQRCRDQGLPLRVTALITHPHLAWLRDQGIRDGFGDPWLRIGGIKAFVDGAVAGRTCAVAQPFEGSQDTGVLTVDAGQVQALVDAVTAAGLRLAVHANGERAIEMVLDALERAADDGGLRHRIEHCSIITREILGRMAALRAIAVPFGSYAYFHGDNLLEWYGSARLERMFAHRSMLEAGLSVAGSSDYPCGPWEPLLGLQSCVTRLSRTGHPVGLSQRLSLREAIEVYTIGSATASGEEGIKGRLAPGYLADLTVLAGDLFAVPPEELAQVPVLATWVGGIPRYENPGN